MRRLAQFVRLRASRVSRRSSCLACVSRLRASRVSRLASVVLSRVRLASVCVCSRQGFRMRASASCASRVRLASASRVCVSRLSRVCLRLFTSRVPNACVLSRVCLASVVLSRVRLASRVGRLVSLLSVSL